MYNEGIDMILIFQNNVFTLRPGCCAYRLCRYHIENIINFGQLI